MEAVNSCRTTERTRIVFAIACGVVAALFMAAFTVSARADNLPDPYTQIINHQIPVSAQSSPGRDGPPTYMWDGWGDYYLGPNGLEMRFTSSGTSAVIGWVLTAESLGVGTTIAGDASTLGDVILGGVKSAKLRGALTTVDVLVAQPLGGILRDIALKNLCLGVTIPNGAVSSALNRAVALMGANLLQAFKGPSATDFRVWFERCGGAKTAGNGDIVVRTQFPTVIPAQAIPALTIYTYSVYHTGGIGLNVRSGPGAGYTKVGHIAEGAALNIVCQVHGQRVLAETDIWDQLASGGYVYDEYVNTPNIGVFSIRQC